jgi:hypothetical protein
MENQWKKRIQRPIGVYVCTTLIFLRFGLFQFINYYTAIRAENGEVPFQIIVVSLGLCVFTAASTIWAFIGDNEGRILMLIFVALNLFWIIFLASFNLTDEITENDKDGFVYIYNSIFTLFLLIPFYWYFFSKNVVAYYKQND